MKKIILLITVLMVILGGYIIAQNRFIFLGGSPREGLRMDGKMDTIGAKIDFLDCKYFYVFASIDTSIANDSCLGKIPAIRGEYAYLNSWGKKMRSHDSSKTWFPLIDSIARVDTVYRFSLEPAPAFGCSVRWILYDNLTNTDQRKIMLKFGVEGE